MKVQIRKSSLRDTASYLGIQSNIPEASPEGNCQELYLPNHAIVLHGFPPAVHSLYLDVINASMRRSSELLNLEDSWSWYSAVSVTAYLQQSSSVSSISL